MKERLFNAFLLLAVAAALAMTLTREGRSTAAAAPAVSPSAPALSAAEAYRRQRADARQNSLDALLALLDDPLVSPETKALAEKELLDVAKNSEIELAAEAALIGRGYENGLCAARQGAVTVFVDGELSAGDAELLLSVIGEASGLEREKIRLTGY